MAVIDRRCRISNQSFEISDGDQAFYSKLGVPLPTLCPEERQLRRMAFANQRTLFHRTCNGSGKKVISNYAPDQTVPVFDIEFWYSDGWDKFATGRDFDFNRPFFDQFAELMTVAPRPNLQRAPQYDENSDYTNYAGKNKNCYLIFDSDKNRDCLHSYSINSCNDVAECYRIESCELCYECVDCTNCFDSRYLQNCENCSTSSFLRNCIGCTNCFGCVGLRNKNYYFFNEACSKSDYTARVAALQMDKRSNLKKLAADFAEFCRQFPERYMQGVQNEEVVGDYLTFSKNADHCFDSRKLWDCRFVVQAFDDAKNCMDCTEIGDGVELLYESCYVGYGGNFVRFTTHCLGRVANLAYCYYCPFSTNCFGCVGLHHAEYCILNKQYSQSEYEALLPKMIAHMERTKEWGEFFPPQIAPFPYNRTHAYEYFPLSKQEALARGYMWAEKDQTEYKSTNTVPPETIAETADAICAALLSCRETGKNFKIQKAELALYQKLNVPVPDLCFDVRHARRLRSRNGRKLVKRKCSACGIALLTTVTPERFEQVLCESDFQRAAEN